MPTKKVDGQTVEITQDEYDAMFPVPTLDEQKAAKLAALAYKRWQVATGGITVESLSVPTDDTTQLKATAAYVKATKDSDFSISSWKLPDGTFMALDNATIIAIGDAITDHIEACFDNEATLTTAINAAADQTALNAVDITSGWPS